MPLRDHLAPPLRDELDYLSFQAGWVATLASSLNETLPDGFRAAPRASVGLSAGPLTTAAQNRAFPCVWSGRDADRSIPFEFDGPSCEVLVHGYRDGRYLAGAIELVSEGNKDRPEAREAFVAKCETYLQRGVGVIILDAITTRSKNLHDHLMARVGPPDLDPWGERLYVTAYRPMGKNGSARLAIWQEALALGKPIPQMPLWLLYGPSVTVELERTYEETFRQLRLPTD